MRPSAITLCLLTLSCIVGQAHAAGTDCITLQAPDQKLDAGSVKRAERVWLMAELRGEVDTVDCMLEPDYTEVRFDGSVGHKNDILKGAARAKGSTKPIPIIEWTGIVVKGDSATAYSVQHKHDVDGKPMTLFFTDTFVYHDGAWHPYFSVNAGAVTELKLKD